MDKRVIFNKSYLHSCIRSRVKFGEKGSVAIDQTPAQSFNIDPATGRPMSDIQRLVHMQNDLAMSQAFASLNEFKSNFLPADIDESEALRFMCPRLSQLPSELLSYKEGLVKYQLEQQKAKDLAAAAAAREKADKEYFESIKNASKKSETKIDTK